MLGTTFNVSFIKLFSRILFLSKMYKKTSQIHFIVKSRRGELKLLTFSACYTVTDKTFLSLVVNNLSRSMGFFIDSRLLVRKLVLQMQ